MPPRKKPTSAKQKKADQKLKRAIKRGDVEPPEAKKRPHKKGRPSRNQIAPGADPARPLQLQSTFVRLPPKYLESTKNVASNIPLDRPISPSVAVFANPFTGTFDANAFSCPRRPKWRFDMSKLEVERNEEGLFKKWLAESDDIVEKWQAELDAKRQALAPASDSGEPQLIMPAAPTYFERNLEVWRQLWRVTEVSQIILILLDSRCPSVHLPPSLISYLGNRKAILVLTKVDITGPERTHAWKEYLHAKYPGLPIVEVESYARKDESAVHQGKGQFQPSIPHNFRQELIEAIKKVHSELLDPPEKVKGHPERLKAWIPPVKPEVDWDAVFTAQGDKVGMSVGGAAVPRLDEDNDNDEGVEDGDPETGRERQPPGILTIGLIGQPNVGKSSLLNALFGASRVRASKTPGKTKHFQTLFWTSDVRLVDCPGLVIPNFVEMEMQVLSGILPISRVSAIAACIHYASTRLPLERIFQLRHPSLDEAPSVDKRTWRDGMARPATSSQDKANVWTAMDVLAAFANLKGWVTAKAGRPDVNRAGNAILRALAEGRVSWGFWPPGTEKADAEGLGIWIPGKDTIGSDTESDSDERDEHATEEASDVDDSEEDLSDHSVGGRIVGSGRFGALAIDDKEESESSEE